MIFLLYSLYLIFYWPRDLVKHFNKSISPHIVHFDYTLDKNIRVEEFGDDPKYKLFAIGSHVNPNRSVIVFIPGGSFVRSEPDLSTLVELSENNNVITCNYPILFENSVTYTKSFLDKFLTMVHERYPNSKLTLIGLSAGAFYAAQLLNDNKHNHYVERFVGVSGYYGRKYTNIFLLKWLDFLYLRELPPIQTPLSCEKIMLITGDVDMLKNDTIQFAKTLNITPNVYSGGHELFGNNTKSQHRQLISDILKFIDS